MSAHQSSSRLALNIRECKMAVNKNGTTNLDEELQKAAGRVVSHMNNDHASSILAYAHAFGGDGCASAVSAKMIGLDREGFLVEVTLANGERKDVLIKYDREMKSAGQLHRIAVDMHFAAYGKLGGA